MDNKVKHKDKNRAFIDISESRHKKIFGKENMGLTDKQVDEICETVENNLDNEALVEELVDLLWETEAMEEKKRKLGNEAYSDGVDAEKYGDIPPYRY